jgi:DNA-binding transcriptional LysR family regulator
MHIFWNIVILLCGNLLFHKAARVLNYSQSAVSAQIQALEESLETRLFDRLPRRGITLTEAGARLLDYADRLLGLADEARSAVAGNRPKGQLHIRMPETLSVHYLPRLLGGFRTAYPDCSLTFSACTLSSLEKDLSGGVYDLAFLIDESISLKDLKIKYVCGIQLCFAVHPGHRLVRNRTISLQELASELLLVNRTDCSYRRMIERLLVDAEISPVTIVELNSVAATLACVAHGIGVAMVPDIAIETGVRQGCLARLQMADGPLEAGILMIWHREKFISPVMAAFMDMAMNYIRDIPCTVSNVGAW